MNNKTILITIISILVFLAISQTAFSWEETETHPYISKVASEQSILSSDKDDYLKKLGFNKGFDEVLEWRGNAWIISKWLQEGAKLEDEGTNWEMITNVGRSNNHFHNPLSPSWANAGLNDDYTLGEIVYNVVGQSALLWAQDPAKQGAFRNDKAEWDWSWQTIRAYYYMALTSTSAIMRPEYFARTFRGVGHQMHLIQDMAVPAHVRNDSHVRDMLMYEKIGLQHFETWAKKENEKIKTFAAQYTPAKHKPIVDMSINNGDFIPTTQFYDSNKYAGSTPPIVADLTWGLSEYTNANFVSDDTIFTDTFSSSDLKYFPYPRYNPSCYQVVTDVIGANPEGGSIVEEYVNRTCDGAKIDKFLAFNPSHNLFSSSTGDRSSFFIDHAVYEAHAKELVPMAVGYSVALLDYFFRGQIEISAPRGSVYSLADGSKTPQQFSHVKAKIRNITPLTKDAEGKAMTYEEMKEGTIWAVASYKIDPNYMPDLSGTPPTKAIMDKVAFYSYSVSAPITVASIKSDKPQEYTFDFTQSPIPAGVTDLTLQVVFKGSLGTEKDIAVAVGMKDLTEPTHILIWNNSDLFSYEYHLYTVATFKNKYSYNPDDRFYPRSMTLEMTFDAEIPNGIISRFYLDPGQHARLITLFDTSNSQYPMHLIQKAHAANYSIMDWYVNMDGAINQDYGSANQYGWVGTTPKIHRNHKYHSRDYFMECNNYVPQGEYYVCPPFLENEANSVAPAAVDPIMDATIIFPNFQTSILQAP